MSALTLNSSDYYTQSVTALATEYAKKQNIFQTPSISKVSINVGIGKFDPKQKKDIEEYLVKLTGQKPKSVLSRQSIAGFKLRKGEVVGLVVTLRGKKMHNFLLNLIYLALPRSRDFKGIKATAFDKNNAGYSLGIENASIFPAVGFDASVQFGMQINITFKHPSEKNKELLHKLSFPFKK